MGISGRIARIFLHSQMTPLLALVAVLLGLFAVMVTPREEEPQINVTMANVMIAYPGASARDVANTVARPAEQVLAQIAGVDHVYSVSQPGMAIITVQFKVGEEHIPSLVKLYDVVHSNSDWLPVTLGVEQPIIKAKGIDDVPVVALTLWRKQPAGGGIELTQVAHAIESELKRVPGTRAVNTLGATQRTVRVLLDAQSLNAHRLTVRDVRAALQSANVAQDAGNLVQGNREVRVQTGSFLADAEEVKQLVVGVADGKPVFLHDVAEVIDGADQPGSYVWFGTGAAADEGASVQGEFPAVTVAVTKKPGANAVEIAEHLMARVEELKGSVIPDDVEVSVTRNYGETANDKAMKLIQKLIFATAAVVALVWFAMGRREALVVGIAVLLTLALTLFASWAWGFTLNRVSLFALIFSIGILVDDAIVVVENIHRRRALAQHQPLSEIIPEAVDEVGSPTILATLTVIAALLPMAFVSGLMGPYMSPIPINASMGMLISLAVAFVITPWLAHRFAGTHHAAHNFPSPQSSDETTSHSTKPASGQVAGYPASGRGGEREVGQAGILSQDKNSQKQFSNPGRGGAAYRFFHERLGPFLNREHGKSARRKLWLSIAAALLLAVSLAVVKLVVLKMLPFDNKSEFQVVVDMPAGSALEKTSGVLREVGAHLATVPEVTDYQAYAGTASPINFNGLVRQYYLRNASEQGDIQVNLKDKHERDRSSHEVALSVQAPLQKIADKWGAKLKIVEVPPGPPVMSPIVAEIYGPDYEGARQVAGQVREAFGKTEHIVGIDDSAGEAAPKLHLRVLQSKAALLGVAPHDIVEAIAMALGGQDVTSLHDEHAKYAPPLRIALPPERRLDDALNLRVRARDGALVPLSEVVQAVPVLRDHPIHHKDLLPVVYVTGNLSGGLDSPLYGMFGINARVDGMALEQGGALESRFFSQPSDPYAGYALKWDGEWQVTFETFRDMGLAYGVGLVLIYLLVVAQFKSYLVPLVIMAPIPLTIIGVMPGHALFGAQFTATSMIGMIALAGIIVRNSILLVDFVNLKLAEGADLQEAVIAAAAARAKPIILTGLAAMLGALFILDDPIFNGLALALIFGILVSTLLTLVVIPVLYYATLYRKFQ